MDGRSVWTTVGKALWKASDAVSLVDALSEHIDTAKKLIASDSTTTERVAAALTLGTELLPVSANDLAPVVEGVAGLAGAAIVRGGPKGGSSEQDRVTKPFKDQDGRERHHVIQDAAVENIPGYKYGDAPTVALPGRSSNPDTAHGKTRPVQKQKGGGTYGAERRIGCKALRRAGLSQSTARRAIEEADDYFGTLGVTLDTVLQIPRDRR